MSKNLSRDPSLYRARNGDTLDALNTSMAEAQARLDKAREECAKAEATVAPFRAAVIEAESQRSNIACRLNIFWNEIRYEAKVKQHHVLHSQDDGDQILTVKPDRQ